LLGDPSIEGKGVEMEREGEKEREKKKENLFSCRNSIFEYLSFSPPPQFLSN
jgi:hypothetical protein